MKRNQKGFGVVEIIIIVVLLALVGVGGWYVWQANNNSNNGTSTNTQQNANTSTTKSVEISEWGVKINDPDSRNLQTEAKKICGAECDTNNSYFVKDNNSAYFARCSYPILLSKSTAELAAQNPANDKKVGDVYIHVGLGHFQSQCDNLADGDEAYESALRQYILDNLVKL